MPRMALMGAGGSAGYIGPYDDIPSITAAYGMRRLLSSYESNLIRLRRSSDNVEQDFGYVANGDLDTAAIATFLGANSGLVVTWYDQSGNGNNATQSTAANQPTYVSQAGGMAFDGTNDSLAPGITPATNNSMSAIVKFSNASGNAGCLLGWSDSASFLLFPRFNSGTQRVYQNGQGGAVVPTGALTAGVMAIAGLTGYLDGASDGTMTSIAGGTMGPLRIGARGRPASGVDTQYTGRIAELVISSSTYTAQQVGDITTIMQGA